MADGTSSDRPDTRADNEHPQPSQAILQVLADAHGSPAEQKPVSLANINVDQTGTSDTIFTHFPNGVTYGTGNGVLHLDSPPGGHLENGNKIVDAHNKVVAEVDNDKVFHVHTANGDYSETKDGKVTFTPRTGRDDLSALHHNGPVSPTHFENFGITTHNHMTKFLNGIEFDPRTGKVNVPAEISGSFNEVKDSDGRVGTDGSGRVLYRVDQTGIHVPTAGGMLSQNFNGAVHFEGTTPATKSLPSVILTDASKDQGHKKQD